MVAEKKSGMPEGAEMLILAGAMFLLTVGLIVLMAKLA
jgi:hypothetical protein